MRKEFEIYLKNNRLPEKYFGYCTTIETAFGGKDIDAIISSHKNITNVRNKLQSITTSKGSINCYITALNHYLKFILSYSKPSIVSRAISYSSQYHVARAEGVPLSADVSFICETLEQEYSRIVRFAEKLFPQLELKYIPIIISNEEPMQDSPDGGDKLLGAFFASDKPYIEIYYLNGNPHNAAAFRKCLAHEYMHYLHYVIAGNKFDEASRKLKEGLADFFGVLYSIQRGTKEDLKVAKARYDRWVKYFDTYWPYASALNFYKVHGKEMNFSSDYAKYKSHGCIDKFIQVFYSTKYPDDAYKAMIED